MYMSLQITFTLGTFHNITCQTTSNNPRLLALDTLGNATQNRTNPSSVVSSTNVVTFTGIFTTQNLKLYTSLE